MIARHNADLSVVVSNAFEHCQKSFEVGTERHRQRMFDENDTVALANAIDGLIVDSFERRFPEQIKFVRLP